MKIKKYIQFMNERVERTGTYEYGCVLLELDLPGWDRLISTINSEDLYQPNDGRHGIETDPHVTLKFGVDGNVSDQEVEKILLDNPLTEKIHIEKIDLFQNEEFDVVKLKVTLTPQLVKLNQELSKLPNHDKFPDYKPHITIAYVKPGLGSKYIIDNFDGYATPYKIIYSKPDGKKFYYNI